MCAPLPPTRRRCRRCRRWVNKQWRERGEEIWVDGAFWYLENALRLLREHHEDDSASGSGSSSGEEESSAAAAAREAPGCSCCSGSGTLGGQESMGEQRGSCACGWRSAGAAAARDPPRLAALFRRCPDHPWCAGCRPFRLIMLLLPAPSPAVQGGPLRGLTWAAAARPQQRCTHGAAAALAR